MKNPQLIKKIKKSEEQIAQGKFTKSHSKMSDEEIDDLLKH